MNCPISLTCSIRCSLIFLSWSSVRFYFTIILKSPWRQISAHPPCRVSFGHVQGGAPPCHPTCSTAWPYHRKPDSHSWARVRSVPPPSSFTAINPEKRDSLLPDLDCTSHLKLRYSFKHLSFLTWPASHSSSPLRTSCKVRCIQSPEFISFPLSCWYLKIGHQLSRCPYRVCSGWLPAIPRLWKTIHLSSGTCWDCFPSC